MVGSITSRLRPALEMMRLPLLVTAISNTQAAYFLHTVARDRPWNPGGAVSLVAMSVGLHAFATVMNDIIDVRRDQYLMPQRPLVAGRLNMQEAYLLAAGLLVLGVGGGLTFAVAFGGGLISPLFLAWTILLIFFYNLTGKFVGAVGILTLGLIRFFHAAAAQPHLHMVWHPLVLMDHVVILSAICYVLQSKRPRLSKGHRLAIAVGLAGLNLLLAGGVAIATFFRVQSVGDLPEAIGLTQALVWPLIAGSVFAAFVVALLLSLRETQGLSPREFLDRRRRTGRKLMLAGLLWLVIYDIAFVYGYGFALR